jgi:hypothetical protein
MKKSLNMHDKWLVYELIWHENGKFTHMQGYEIEGQIHFNLWGFGLYRGMALSMKKKGVEERGCILWIFSGVFIHWRHSNFLDDLPLLDLTPLPKYSSLVVRLSPLVLSYLKNKFFIISSFQVGILSLPSGFVLFYGGSV